MELKIDQELIAAAFNKTASRALESSLCGYEVQAAIAAVVTREVAEGAIAEAIKQAVQQIDTSELTQALAEELQRSTVRATVAILQDGLMATICKLRGIGDYSTEDKAARAKLRAELFSE